MQYPESADPTETGRMCKQLFLDHSRTKSPIASLVGYEDTAVLEEVEVSNEGFSNSRIPPSLQKDVVDRKVRTLALLFVMRVHPETTPCQCFLDVPIFKDLTWLWETHAKHLTMILLLSGSDLYNWEHA